MAVSSKNSYILYGRGGEAERFLFQNQDIFQKISFCIDKRSVDQFHGLVVYPADHINLYNYIETHYIIVAAGDESIYVEIKKELCNQGLIEWDHFIWSKCFGKKLF